MNLKIIIPTRIPAPIPATNFRVNIFMISTTCGVCEFSMKSMTMKGINTMIGVFTMDSISRNETTFDLALPSMSMITSGDVPDINDVNNNRSEMLVIPKMK